MLLEETCSCIQQWGNLKVMVVVSSVHGRKINLLPTECLALEGKRAKYWSFAAAIDNKQFVYFFGHAKHQQLKEEEDEEGEIFKGFFSQHSKQSLNYFN